MAVRARSAGDGGTMSRWRCAVWKKTKIIVERRKKKEKRIKYNLYIHKIAQEIRRKCSGSHADDAATAAVCVRVYVRRLHDTKPRRTGKRGPVEGAG